MGWKRTWCSYNSILDLSSYVHFLKAFCYTKSIKSCLLPFLPNLYCTSIISGQPLLSDHFSKSRGWPLNRGRAVLHFMFFIKDWTVLPTAIRYGSRPLRTLSRLEWMSSNDMSEISLAVWWSVKKCFDPVVCLERLVGLSTGVRVRKVQVIFESSFCSSYISVVCESACTESSL